MVSVKRKRLGSCSEEEEGASFEMRRQHWVGPQAIPHTSVLTPSSSAGYSLTIFICSLLQLLGERVYLAHTYQSQSIPDGNQGRNSRHEPTYTREAEIHGQRDTAYRLAPHGLHCLLCYTTQDHLPRTSLSTSVISQKNAP